MFLTIRQILDHIFLLFINKNDIKHVYNIYLTFSTMWPVENLENN